MRSASVTLRSVEPDHAEDAALRAASANSRPIARYSGPATLVRPAAPKTSRPTTTSQTHRPAMCRAWTS